MGDFSGAETWCVVINTKKISSSFYSKRNDKFCHWGGFLRMDILVSQLPLGKITRNEYLITCQNNNKWMCLICQEERENSEQIMKSKTTGYFYTHCVMSLSPTKLFSNSHLFLTNSILNLCFFYFFFKLSNVVDKPREIQEAMQRTGN